MKLGVCDRPGCFGMAAPPARFCSSHQAEQQEYDARKVEQNKQRFGKGAWAAGRWVSKDPRWRKLRAAHIKAEPNCRKCGAQGEHVDHIIPHRGDEAMAFDAGNLQTLCARCHKAKTQAENLERRRDARTR